MNIYFRISKHGLRLDSYTPNNPISHSFQNKLQKTRTVITTVAVVATFGAGMITFYFHS